MFAFGRAGECVFENDKDGVCVCALSVWGVCVYVCWDGSFLFLIHTQFQVDARGVRSQGPALSLITLW